MTTATTNTSTKPPVALITGAAQRIGAAIARHLHQAGYNIIIHYCHSDSAATDLAGELNQQRTESAHCLQADLTSTQQVQQLAAFPSLILKSGHRARKSCLRPAGMAIL